MFMTVVGMIVASLVTSTADWKDAEGILLSPLV